MKSRTHPPLYKLDHFVIHKNKNLLGLNGGEGDCGDKAKKFQSSRSECSQIVAKHKEIHRPVSKMGKLIDKQFEPGGVNVVGVAPVFDDVTRHHLIKSVIEHLYCSGLSHVASELERESGFESENADRKEKFLYLTELLTDLRNGKNDKLVDWIERHREKLAEKNSFIEWKIRRLEFCHLLTAAPESTSVKQLIQAGQVLAKTRCDTRQNNTELQQLMTAILYRNKIEKAQFSKASFKLKLKHNLKDENKYRERISEIGRREVASII